ncbi:mechanosensitive ion channel [Alkalicoccobacillus gibsonii]|uniref:Mechanosensitive ion channel n=1 Tax=Alkalicoccobacillus gibsonii TaxID=79881 RepID=A0ABU9VE99_9BACI
MNGVTNSFRNMFDQIVSNIPNVVYALLLLLLAFAVATIVKGILEKGLKKLGVQRLLAKGRLVPTEEKGLDTLKSLATIAYYLVFILFIPSILDALNMNSVSQPISSMMQKLLAFLPNLFAAAIILTIGIIVIRFVRNLVYNLLNGLQIDRFFNKIYIGKQEQPPKETLSTILSNIVMFVLLVPVITIALEALNIQMISQPIVSVLDRVIGMIPNIFVAIVLVIVGYYLARFVSGLLVSLLNRTGINSIYGYFGFRPTSDGTPRFQLSEILGQIVKVLIILFFTVEALNVLRLNVLNQIGNSIIVYLPMLVSALLILGLGLVAANLLQQLIARYTGSSFSANIVKYVIILFAVFMTLDQLGFATSIVNLAFLLILGSLAVAFAIAFGIGGREFAKRQLTKFESKLERKDSASSKDQEPPHPMD